jgi:NCK-associated protein 1
MAHVSFKIKEVDGGGMPRWSEYLSIEEPPPSALASWRSMAVDGSQGSSAGGQKHLQMDPVVQLARVADGLLAKMYRLNSVLDYPDPTAHSFSDAFWKAGAFPNFPRICVALSKKFPEHPNRLQLERVRIQSTASCFSSLLMEAYLDPTDGGATKIFAGR